MSGKDVLLNEVRAMLEKAGYSTDEQNTVVYSFKSFLDYISSCNLLDKFLLKSHELLNKINKKIREGKSADNIASTLALNNGSMSFMFVREQLEEHIKQVLIDCLMSAASYYKMACNSEGLQQVDILKKLKEDGIKVDNSIDLTSPTVLVAFSTELSLKILYSLKNYNAIVNSCWSDFLQDYHSGIISSYFIDKVSMINAVTGDWGRINVSPVTQNTMDNVANNFMGNIPVNFPRIDASTGNVVVNGHTLYKVFDALPEEYQTMIKYQIATAFSRGDMKSLEQKVVGAIDYFLMISSVDSKLGNIDSTQDMVINSNNFDKMRYLVDQLGSKELVFSLVFAISSYIVARSELEAVSFSATKNSNYSSKGIQYTEKLDELIKANEDKKKLLDYIVSNSDLLREAKKLNAKDLYVLVDMFNKDEIDWMSNTCNQNNYCSFKEMLYYCIFFKKHIDSYEFRYDNEKYKNINKLFYTIKTTNNLARLGTELAQWFAEIDIYSLSQEEFDVLRLFDNQYIFNSLSYRDRILYKKCSELGVPFKIYYMSRSYSAVIDSYISGKEISIDDFEKQILTRASRRFNGCIALSREILTTVDESDILYDTLIREFGGIENVPTFLLALKYSDIALILHYCEQNGISISDWSYQMISSSCFYCKVNYYLRKLRDDYSSSFLYNYVSDVPIIPDDLKDKILTEGNVRLYFPQTDRNYQKFLDKVVVGGYDFKEKLDQLMKEYGISVDAYESDVVDVEDLLRIGIDYLSAVFLRKQCNKSHVDTLIKCFEKYGIPFEFIPLIVTGKLSFDELIAKSEFFGNKGCDLSNIPSYYYSSSEVTKEHFERIFEMFEGIYSYDKIPKVYVTNSIDKLEKLINQLKAENIDIYDFTSYISNDKSIFVVSDAALESFVTVYKMMRQIEVTADMVVKTFDSIVSDYVFCRTYLGDTDSVELLIAVLYKSSKDVFKIRELCESAGKDFYFELLYFDIDFLKDNFDRVWFMLDGYKMTEAKFGRQEAVNFMKNCNNRKNYGSPNSGSGPKR